MCAPEIERDVACYDVDGHPVRVDWFGPVAGRPLPTVILLHGRDGPDGVAGDRPYADLASVVAAGGFRVALPHYFNRSPQDELPGGILDEVGREVERFGLWLQAISVVIRAASGTAEPLGLLGYSLGGYLALTTAMSRPGVAAVASCYAGVPTPFVGLAANLPPTLVLHGAEDRVVPVTEAASLSRLCRRHQIPHEVHIYPRAGHGFCGLDAADALGRVVSFFHRQLGSGGPSAEPGAADGGGT